MDVLSGSGYGFASYANDGSDRFGAQWVISTSAIWEPLHATDLDSDVRRLYASAFLIF